MKKADMMKIMMKMTRVIWVCAASTDRKKKRKKIMTKMRMKMNMVAGKLIWDNRDIRAVDLAV